ncbi:Sec8 exocyst complex component-specific domain-containing protein [Multifurca ochricompacta]|uniref:Exocyst complex component Sec8 n=1 Tax=Multifurca ochricompacta TaxID=376703 RepID=A0AAD4MDL6_9AGAM|nr:Sec8 exocyst complex component-specific domain-containing protein [Multifurca ochricompacta]
MSRQTPPFPSKRPPLLGLDTSSTTKPLQINRPPRPTTPSNGSLVSSSSPTGPSRPQRSELRANKAPDYSVSDAVLQARASRDRKDSASTTRSDRSDPNSYHSVNRNSPAPRTRRTARSGTESDITSPASLTAVMSAFQSGLRKKAMKTYGDDQWEERQLAIEAENATQERIKRRMPGRRQNGAAKAGDIDAVLDRIKDDWEFVIDPEFNPVDLALQILDDSSAGKDMGSFRRTKLMLSQALKGSVDKHFQAFAAALPHHASLLNHLGATQTQIKNARTVLQEAKDSLGNKRADLVQMWTRGQTLEEMLRILDQIERLRLVPDVLESLISEKRLLQAAVLLVRSLKTIKKQDMLDIGAVADLRAYLIGQESALRDILIDELHNHLYLKVFWCETRWVAYTVGQQSLPRVEVEDGPLEPSGLARRPVSPSSPTTTNSPSQYSRLTRYLQDLALRPNDPPGDIDDSKMGSSGLGKFASTSPSYSTSGGPSSVTSFPSLSNLTNVSQSQNQWNPETDSFTYIEALLESLSVLGKLGSGLDTVAQRLPNEMFALVNSTVDEVSERAEYNRRTSLSFGNNAGPKGHSTYVVTSKPAVTGGLPLDISSMLVDANPVGHSPLISPLQLRLTALESSAKHEDHEILRDLFWTLYSKVDAVMQGLRVVYEVANRIGSRRDFRDASGTKSGALFPLTEIWMPVQAEIRTLVKDYVTDEEQGFISGRNPISSINDILREGRFMRDKSKHVFRFADTDLKLVAKSLREHEDELNRVLKETVPGLVQGSSETAVQATLATVGIDERLLGTDQHHRLLVKPHAFHINVLFQPMLAFIDRVTEILPSGFEAARASSEDLDEFVLKVYLPQLEEKVSLLFHQAVTGPEAFMPDASSIWLSIEPLVNASTTLMALINSLCVMLRTTPFHRENYARLILTVIIQFYQRCSDRFQALITSHPSADQEPCAAIAAQWAQTPEIAACLSDLYHTPETGTNNNELHRRECDAEARLMSDKSIVKGDLIGPLRNVSALCHLYRSVLWFTAGLNQLRAVLEDNLSPTSALQLEPASAITPYMSTFPSILPLSPEEQLQLPLSKEMSLRFHALLKTYDQLSELILHTIRIDVRCRVGHYLDLAMRHGNYRIDREIDEPDPHIIDLNLELGEYHGIVSTTLPPQEQKFVFSGIGFLMDDLLIHNARHIRFANALGMKKISRNMLALQQCVKTIVHDPRDGELLRAKRYYSLFLLNPRDMLALIRKQLIFTFDQYEVMLNLQCGVDQSQAGRSGAQAMDKDYSMYIIDLHGLEIEAQKDTY